MKGKKSDKADPQTLGGLARAESLTPQKRSEIARRAAETRWSGPKTPLATHGDADHPLVIGDHQIPCYVLEDGTRVIAQRGIQRSLGLSTSGGGEGAHRMARFVERLEAKGVKYKDLASRMRNPIVFRIPGGGNEAFGYEATILHDLCELVLLASGAGVLLPQQQHIVIECKKLLSAFAKVGIVALVDEATGYQNVRHKEELRMILEAYISPHFLPWTMRFPETFYREMFRLWGWEYSPKSTKRPRLAARLTNILVYEQLPDGVIEELKAKNPLNEKGQRKHRQHQFLSDNIGNPHLEKQVASITTLMTASTTRKMFLKMFKRVKKKPRIEQGDMDDALDIDIED